MMDPALQAERRRFGLTILLLILVPAVLWFAFPFAVARFCLGCATALAWLFALAHFEDDAILNRLLRREQAGRRARR